MALLIYDDDADGDDGTGDHGQWTLDSGLWTVDSKTVDSKRPYVSADHGQWTLDNGLKEIPPLRSFGWCPMSGT